MRTQSPLISRVVPLAAGVLIAVAFLEVRNWSERDASTATGTLDAAAPPLPSMESSGQKAAAAAATPVVAAALELDEMSETFRNTTFLIAIRDAGFVCDDVVAAHAGGEHVWSASCRDMRGYEIEVQAAGDLRVRPLAQYIDGLAPRAVPLRSDEFLREPDRRPRELPR